MGFYLGLNAVNFAEADRPFHRLTQQELAEMFFTLGLQCHFSIPYGSSFPMVSEFESVRAIAATLYSNGMCIASLLLYLVTGCVMSMYMDFVIFS
jgi:hypothetical protein